MDSQLVFKMARLLNRLREERRISKRQLADEAGVNPSVVTRAEGGEDAKLSTWAKLFGGLGYEVLLGYQETCDEVGDLLSEEAERRLERRLEGLRAGKRRYF